MRTGIRACPISNIVHHLHVRTCFSSLAYSSCSAGVNSAAFERVGSNRPEAPIASEASIARRSIACCGFGAQARRLIAPDRREDRIIDDGTPDIKARRLLFEESCENAMMVAPKAQKHVKNNTCDSFSI